jgi:ABC-type multidrug transport system ATPase subunit
MLTGELEPTRGGFELSSGIVVGYCPQENSLDELLTVREMLRAYCYMRGVQAGEPTNEVLQIFYCFKGRLRLSSEYSLDNIMRLISFQLLCTNPRLVAPSSYNLFEALFTLSFSFQSIAKSLSNFGLDSYTDVRCGHLSGGTKRKLCAAVSLLGHPQLVLMDEPTSGMDVLAKRQGRDSINSCGILS